MKVDYSKYAPEMLRATLKWNVILEKADQEGWGELARQVHAEVMDLVCEKECEGESK